MSSCEEVDIMSGVEGGEIVVMFFVAAMKEVERSSLKCVELSFG